MLCSDELKIKYGILESWFIIRVTRIMAVTMVRMVSEKTALRMSFCHNDMRAFHNTAIGIHITKSASVSIILATKLLGTH